MLTDQDVNKRLDEDVALAIGLIYEKRPSPRYKERDILGAELLGWWDGEGYVSYDVPKYSTDLNAAFAAAELVGCRRQGLHIAQILYGWWCTIDGKDHGVIAETPALAICAAILKLKESGDGTGRERSDQSA